MYLFGYIYFFSLFTRIRPHSKYAVYVDRSEMHTSHTYFKWQTNWYKCTENREENEKNSDSVLRFAWKIRSKGTAWNKWKREQKSWTELQKKGTIFRCWVGWGQCACMHKATYLQPFGAIAVIDLLYITVSRMFGWKCTQCNATERECILHASLSTLHFPFSLYVHQQYPTMMC